MKKSNDVKNDILLVSQELIQLKGYNGFSYRDIAAAVGVKTSSIHYHFPTKENLVINVVSNYLNIVLQGLDNIDNNAHYDTVTKLSKSLDFIFEHTFFTDKRMCLAGMLTAELMTLSDEILACLKHFFLKLESRLTDLLEEGAKNKTLKLQQSPQHLAQTIISLIEGGLLMARLYEDKTRLARIKQTIQSMI